MKFPARNAHQQQQQQRKIPSMTTAAAVTTARRKQRPPRRRVVPFLLALVVVALFVALPVTIILSTVTTTTSLSSSSYLFDLLEDFTYHEPRRRPWRNIHNDTTSQHDRANHVIFYHIYIPPRKGKVGQAKALEVVEEQLAQIAASRNMMMMIIMKSSRAKHNNSTSSQQRSTTPVWTVYYTTTGVQNVITSSWMRHACRVRFLTCIPTEPHLLVGDEDVTLNHLYDYCQFYRQEVNARNAADTSHNDDDDMAAAVKKEVVVIYLHTKGTHHAAQGRNDAWRRHLTAAVTHPDCLHAVSAATSTTTTTRQHDQLLLGKKKCDVCGLQFYPIWTTFFPGNFWTARCSYVQTLLPLPNYTQALHDAVASALGTNSSSSSLHSSWQAELYRDSNPGNFGLGRFAVEHWVASHPHVQPCDLSESNRITDYWTTASSSSTTTAAAATSIERQQQQQMMLEQHQQYHNWSLALAPRQSIHAPFWFRLNRTALVDILQEPEPTSYKKGTMMRQRRRRLVREWFLLPGFLYRWKRIYGLYPKPDSWIWDWYPNGREWRQSVLFSSSSAAGQQQQPNVALLPLWWLAPPE